MAEKADHNFWMNDSGALPKAVRGRQGAVAAEHPLAAAAGLNVLQGGGNAADAVVAMAAVTGVVQPMMCGLGGDAFMVYYEAVSGRYYALSGSGIAPRGAEREFFARRGFAKMPLAGILTVAVPGAVAAYAKAWERFGSRPFAELFAPAIHYARDGFPVSAALSRQMHLNREKLRRCPATAAIFLRDGAPYQPGEILIQNDLAGSLEMVARNGTETFYRGELAAAILRCSETHGGLFAPEDLANHETTVEEPLAADYRDCTVYQTPPASQGFIMLEMLNILEGFGLGEMVPGSAEAVHLMVEAKKLAYADRLRYAGDPNWVDFPMARLLSKTFAAERRKAINPKRVMAAEYADEAAGDTTSFVAVDRDGNAASFIHSLSLAFGSGVTVGGTGILLNNRAGRGFTLEEGHPNCIAPGKKTMHTLNCYIVARNGKPWLVGGTPGGDGQPQWNVQSISNCIDFGLDLSEAVNAPRWTSFPGTDPANQANRLELWIEERAGRKVIEDLAAKGHRMKVLEAWQGGGAVQIIKVNPENGVLEAYSDPRSEGQALVF
ncbi:MAG: gamma-glutamyltransferase [bacterium]|jgi:gamma-glutamyltranspeptidase/glutathione hydrolase